MKNNRTKNISGKKRRSFVVGMELSFLCAVLLAGFLIIMHLTARTANADDQISRYKYYTSIVVEQGDSLWHIAEKYGGEEYADLREYMDEVIEINQLAGTEIHAGSHLCVPYYAEEYK